MRALKLPATALAALAISFLAHLPAFAQDGDTQEVLRYTLTDSTLTKYIAATQKLAALPAACADEDDGDSDGAASIAQMVAKLDATPDAKGAIQSAGMTTREYVVFSMSLLHNGMAAWAVSQPGGKLPPGVSQANVDFLKRNEAKLKPLEEMEDCGERSVEEEPEE